MKQLLTKRKNIYKTLTLQNRLLIIIVLIFIVFALSKQSITSHTQPDDIKEVLYNINNGRLSLTHNSGEQRELNDIKLSKQENIFRSNNHLIHQRFQKEGALFSSDIYDINLEQNITKIFKKNVTIVYFRDDHNYIYDDQLVSTVVHNNISTKLDILCRTADYLSDKLVCLNTDGNLYYGSINNLENLSLKNKSGSKLLGITFAVDNNAKSIYVASATQEDHPQNYILKLSPINNKLKITHFFPIRGIPIQFTVQKEKVILNVKQQTTTNFIKDYDLEKTDIYSINDTLTKLNQYRHNLMVIY